MRWIFRKLLLREINGFEAAYQAKYETTYDETMRPDFYWFQKYLRGEL